MTKEDVRCALNDLYREFNEFNCSFNKRIDEIIKQCPHEWKYESDPSGDSDWGYICQICGKCEENPK